MRKMGKNEKNWKKWEKMGKIGKIIYKNLTHNIISKNIKIKSKDLLYIMNLMLI